MSSLYEHPILNSPYEPPQWHHALDSKGQPLELPPINKRRPSAEVTPVPNPRKQRTLQSETGSLFTADELQDKRGQTYAVHELVNLIRSHIESWRNLPNPIDWRVTPASARLLTHWRKHKFTGPRPFFCQVEAVETIIWLTEVAKGDRRHKAIWDKLESASRDATPLRER
jgi:type III restriction enzyme